MKNQFKALALVTALFAVSACESTPNFDGEKYATPYTLERTATSTPKAAPVPETVVVVEPAPAPVVQQCDYSAWEEKTTKLTEDLANCRESSSRVRDEYRKELVK